MTPCTSPPSATFGWLSYFWSDMKPIHPIVEALVCRLDDSLREAFEERAGILQFEAGSLRELAEPLALLDVVRMNPLAVAGVLCLGATVAGARVVAITAQEARGKAALAALGGTGAARMDLAVAVASLGGSARLTPINRAAAKREISRI